MAARALLITNPAAARTHARAVHAIESTLSKGGWRVDLATTGGSGDARRLAQAAVEDGHEMVVVFGGDGTTMQAAAALVGTGVHLGVIPGGTGNLLAGNLRIAAAPGRAAAQLIRGRPRRLDLGRMERSDGVHYFAVACGAGYDARVMAETPTQHKRLWGMAAYVATTFRLMPELKSTTHHITVDGVGFEAQASLVLVANCGEVIPPYVKLRSGISPEDGLLDLIVIRADSFTQSVRAIWELLREGRNLAGRPGRIAYARGREIRVETEPRQPVQLDGEPGGFTPFTVNVEPGAITVMAPASR